MDLFRRAPLFDDGASKAQEATRDYVLRVENGDAPLLNVFGGKLTTYRRLAESALEKIGETIGERAGNGRPYRICRAAIFRPPAMTTRSRSSGRAILS